MARLIRGDGAEFDVYPQFTTRFGKLDFHAFVGEAVGVFVLGAHTVMVASLIGASVGALRNCKAIRMIRNSALEPLAEIYGPVLVVGREELDLNEFLAQ